MAIARVVQVREPVALLLPRQKSSQNSFLSEVAAHMEVFFAFQPRPVLSHYSNNSYEYTKTTATFFLFCFRLRLLL